MKIIASVSLLVLALTFAWVMWQQFNPDSIVRSEARLIGTMIALVIFFVFKMIKLK